MEKVENGSSPQTYGQYLAATLKYFGDSARCILWREGDYRWYEEIHTLAHVALLNYRKDLGMPISKFYDSRITFQDWGALSAVDRTFGIYSHHDLAYFSVVLYSTITKYDFQSDNEIDQLMKEIFIRAIVPFTNQMQLYLKAKSADTKNSVEMQNSYKQACSFLDTCAEVMIHKVLRECPGADKDDRFMKYLLRKSDDYKEFAMMDTIPEESKAAVAEYIEGVVSRTEDESELRIIFEDALSQFVEEKKLTELKNDFLDGVKFTPSKEVVEQKYIHHAETIKSKIQAAEEADRKGDEETLTECINIARDTLRSFHRVVYKQLSRKRS